MASLTQITGTAYDASGAPLAAGFLMIRPSQDVSVDGKQICSSSLRFELDGNGSILGTRYLWATALMSPDSAYYIVTAFNSNGQRAWGAIQCRVPDVALFDIAGWTTTTPSTN